VDLPLEYVRLGLRFDRLESGFVDAYTGDPRVRADVLDGRAPAPPVATLASATPASLAELVDALLSPTRAGRPSSAEWVAIRLEQIRRELGGSSRRLPPDHVGPFRGLGRFEAVDRDVYFGRSSEVAAALETLRGRGLVALLGPSGSGKSSLARAGVLPAVHAADGETIVPGRIYIAPPDFHLLFEQTTIRLVRGPRENGNRPAIDPMFRSAAIAFGPRVIGVVLSGNLDDGTAGLAAIQRHGGIAVAQDPEDALFASMPKSAIDHLPVDHVAPIRRMGALLTELIQEPIANGGQPVSPDDAMENELSAGNLEAIEHPELHPGKVSPYSCPDCGGVLWELRDGELLRFRCRVGHAWTGEGLVGRQTDTFDEALWTALRALEENAALSRQIAARHRKRGMERLAVRLDEQASLIEARAELIRSALAQTNRVDGALDEETNVVEDKAI